MKGFALYSKDKRMFIFEVLYEFPETQFVGFKRKNEPYNGDFFEIKQQDEVFKISKMFLSDKSRWNAPIGKKYTQLPGGGQIYKVTRQVEYVQDIIKKEPVIKMLQKFFGINPNRKITESRKVKNKIDYIGAIIEDGGEVRKIQKIISSLKLGGEWKVPKNFHMTIVKNEGGNIPFHTKMNLVNKDVMLKIVGIGISGNAIALKEEGDMFSKKDIKHITIAFKKEPKDSDDIKDWRYFKKPFHLNSTIRQIGYGGEVVKDLRLTNS